jgi:hypothetical protein
MSLYVYQEPTRPPRVRIEGVPEDMSSMRFAAWIVTAPHAPEEDELDEDEELDEDDDDDEELDEDVELVEDVELDEDVEPDAELDELDDVDDAAELDDELVVEDELADDAELEEAPEDVLEAPELLVVVPEDAPAPTPVLPPLPPLPNGVGVTPDTQPDAAATAAAATQRDRTRVSIVAL